MNPVEVERWLRRKRTRETAASVAVALAASVGGLIVLAITFWFTYAVIWIGWGGVSAVAELAFGQRLKLTHGWRLTGCWVFLALLFVGNARTTREYLSQYPERRCVPFLHGSGGTGAFAMLLAYPGASSKMITDILYTGPRLVTAAWRCLRRVCRLARLDVGGCTQVLSLLAAQDRAVTNEELAVAFTGWNLPKLMHQLREIDGVVFLDLGLSLTHELREKLEHSVDTSGPR